jgi:hypothetical protein
MTIIPGKRTPRLRRFRPKNGLVVPTAEAVAEALEQVSARSRELKGFGCGRVVC